MMQLEKKYKKILAEPRKKATSTEHFRALLFDAVNTVAEMMNLEGRIVALEFRELEKEENVSNSHNSPVKGVKNWCNEHNDRPNGYPGWRGKVGMVIRDDGYSAIRDLFDEAEGFNTGSGGYSGQNLAVEKLHTMQYELRLYEQDFPAMRGAMLAEKLAIT